MTVHDSHYRYDNAEARLFMAYSIDSWKLICQLFGVWIKMAKPASRLGQ